MIPFRKEISDHLRCCEHLLSLSPDALSLDERQILITYADEITRKFGLGLDVPWLSQQSKNPGHASSDHR
jgi:hypothetical protein